MPTTLTGVQRFAIFSGLDDPADGWEAESSDITLMTAPDDVALHQLPVGLLDAGGAEVLITQLEGARILTRRVVGSKDQRRVLIRGIDAMDTALRTQRRVRYVPEPAPAVVGTIIEEYQRQLDARQRQLDDLANRPGWPTFPSDPDLLAERQAALAAVARLEAAILEEEALAVPEKLGRWTASAIATDLLVGTGLTLFWGVRDYTFTETFDAVGAIYPLLRQLVAPWDQPQPFGVDLWCQGTVLYVTPKLVSPAATETMTVAESRVTDITLGDRRQLPLYGLVELEGRNELGDGFEFFPGDPPVTEGSTVVVPFSVPVPDPSNPAVTISLSEGSHTYRMPDRLLIASTERLHQRNPGSGILELQKEALEETIYEASLYGPAGPLNQPLPLRSNTRISTRVASPTVSGETVMSETSRVEVSWKYDERRFLVAKTTVHRARESNTAAWKEVDRTTETMVDRLDGWVRITTAKSVIDSDGRITSTSHVSEQDAAGFRPGGVRHPFEHVPIIDNGGQGDLTPIRLTATISADATAVPVRYSNRNMTAADLAYIMSLYSAASGLYEYPLRGSGPAMPFLVKAAVLQLTGYTAADGTTAITLYPAQIRRVTLDYEDSERRQAFTGDFEAVYYRSA